ncbi:MAG: phosphoglycerate mutase family protein [Prevotellaceae bacterium]|jgi:probable phosphoglycerate mutase|nr:phosphoglycerate mutase family protein [Prevotellaceae bacterium]
MRTRIIVARHGNTFKNGETPRRAGAKTDLPLVESVKAENIGKYLKSRDIVLSTVYASPLRRTVETADLAVNAMHISLKILKLDEFTEIDYGPDENKTEEEVYARLGNGDRNKGKAIIDAWNREAKVPDGWIAEPEKIMKNWYDFAVNKVLRYDRGRNVLIVSSNGIIRFAPCLTGNFEKFIQEHDIKINTGGICIFEKDENDRFWTCAGWNIKP